jgi:DtxR family transcriptional regulator, Mn-dependent transcriptional regulator
MNKLSQQMEDYLKTIYLLQEKNKNGVNTNAIAAALSVTAASVTGMVKKLTELKLVRHTPYQSVELTKTGDKVALEVIRHHRLLELFLTEDLGYSWDQVHAEADKLEHIISEEFEDRIAARLGDPLIDPHGDPIPAKDGTMITVQQRSLIDLAAGQSAHITRVTDGNPELLRYAAGLGLRPQVRVTLIEAEPFGGPLRLRIGKTEHSIGRELAEKIFVSMEK